MVFLIRSKVEGSLDALNYEYLAFGFYLPGAVGIEIVE